VCSILIKAQWLVYERVANLPVYVLQKFHAELSK
jgi:hypothetical protein